MNASPPSLDIGAPPPVAIGDLQGCRDALDRLLEKIDHSDRTAHAASPPRASPLWFAGDLVNRGPDSLGTLRRLIGLGTRVTAILGNHDLHLLGVAAGVRTLRKNDTLADILAAPDAEALLDWVRRRPLAHYAEGMLMVHAGVLPQWDVEETLAYAREIEEGLRGDGWRAFVARLFGGDDVAWHANLRGDARLRVITSALTRLRFCRADGVMEWKANGGIDSAPPGFMPWFEVPGRRTAHVNVIFGHWAALGLIRRERLYGLDSGCVWGNALSAIRLAPDAAARELFQVPCAKRPAPAPVPAPTPVSG